MPYYTDDSDFANLFKTYRLKAEIATIAEFARLMEDEGFHYDQSLYTHWQKGDRFPKGRKVMCAMLCIFARRGVVTEINQANEFMASAGYRDCTEEEASRIEACMVSRKSETLPARIHRFVGREPYLESLSWELINRRKVFVNGVSGVGKTALSIELGHALASRFRDGVFWIRADIKSNSDIAGEILAFLGTPVQGMLSEDVKIGKIQKQLVGKDCLIILDSVKATGESRLLLKILLDSSVAVFVTSVRPIRTSKKHRAFNLPPFSSPEYREICTQILGKPFLLQNSSKLKRLGETFGYLPIAVAILLSKIAENPEKLDEYIEKGSKNTIQIDKFSYDQKTLFSSLDDVVHTLNERQREVLVSCGIFEGVDFHPSAVAAMHQISKVGAVRILNELVECSLVEKSVGGRFRLHPVVKEYIYKNPTRSEFTARLYRYYTELLRLYSNNSEKRWNLGLQEETMNVFQLLYKLYRHHQTIEVLYLWQLLSNTLFMRGLWVQIIQIKEIIESSSKLEDKPLMLAKFYIEDLGRIYYFWRNTEAMVHYIIEGRNIGKLNNNDEIIGLADQKIGIYQLEKGNYQEANELFVNSIMKLKDNSSAEGLVMTYIYTSLLKMKQGKLDKALRLVLRAQSYKNQNFQTVILANLIKANIKFIKGELTSTQKIIADIVEPEMERKLILGYVMGLVIQGRILLIQGFSRDASVCFDKARNIYIDLNIDTNDITSAWSDFFPPPKEYM